MASSSKSFFQCPCCHCFSLDKKRDRVLNTDSEKITLYECINPVCKGQRFTKCEKCKFMHKLHYWQVCPVCLKHHHYCPCEDFDHEYQYPRCFECCRSVCEEHCQRTDRLTYCTRCLVRTQIRGKCYAFTEKDKPCQNVAKGSNRFCFSHRYYKGPYATDLY
jgi:hypothetical protein